MKYTIYIFIILFSISCKRIEKPKLNASSSIWTKDSHLSFESNTDNWEAVLYTSIQPIDLIISKRGNDSELIFPKGQIHTGESFLVLKHANEKFVYPIEIAVQSLSKNETRYISPKTVNPDSSLVQQKIIVSEDENQQVITIEKKQLFEESFRSLMPFVIAKREVMNNPLSTYYVQAGTCKSIPIKTRINPLNNNLTAIVGELKDAWGNQVADGTAITWHFQISNINFEKVSNAVKGYSYIDFFNDTEKPTSIWASVDKVNSKIIQF